jgi:16S rRNA (cytosine1402-N4)-methyltransferase
VTGHQEGAPGHEPVMLRRTVELIAPVARPGAVIVDCTLGLGGHSGAILRGLPGVEVIGIDRDPQALAIAEQRLDPFGGRFRARRGVFDTADEILAGEGVSAPLAYLFDLGVSSLQLDSDPRGFAYARDTPLDMRMDPEAPLSAADVVNTYSAEELSRVFSRYGEERHARRIAGAVVRKREGSPIRTSDELSEVVRSALPRGPHRSGHPAKRVFQALRIEVNDELGALRSGLADAIRRVEVDGRIVVMSYHSLEDRIVKRMFASGTVSSAPPGLPVVPPEHSPFLVALTRGAETASAAEVESNPRARSVRLRAVAKTRAVPSGWEAAA